MLIIERKIIPALGVDWATRFYDPLVRIFTKEMQFKQALIEKANLNQTHSILDLACGTGTLAIGIKKLFPKIQISAVDADQKILEKAKQKADINNCDVDFSRYFSDALPFPDSKFDRVFSTLSFHHLTRSEKIVTLGEIARVLKQNGEFHIADYGKANSFSQKMLSNIVKVIDGKETTKDNFAGHLESLMSENGFAKIKRGQTFNTLLGTVRLFHAKF